MPLIDTRESRPAYVQFERKTVEDREASVREKRYISMDVDFAILTPIGSKDRIPREVKSWFETLRQNVLESRIPREWLDGYQRAYESWRSGQEIPPTGTPIRGWPLLSPAQQANVVGANILTVEDLAQANDEARRKIGMGSMELVEKAIAWMKQANSPQAKITEELTAMKEQIRRLTGQVEAQVELIQGLKVENAELLEKSRDIHPA